MKTRIDLRRVEALAVQARRYLDLKIVEFAMAAGAGFLLNLVVLSLGLIVIFHSSIVSRAGDPSPAVLGLDVLALCAGDTLAFTINESLTVRGRVEGKGAVSWLARWGRYQMAAWMGNAIITVVQLASLLAFALAPASGSILGAVVSYPITYFVSMRFVWRLREFRGWRPPPVPGESPSSLTPQAPKIARPGRLEEDQRA